MLTRCTCLHIARLLNHFALLRFRRDANKGVMTRFRKETRLPKVRRVWHERRTRSGST
jgi:hypothetical protein